ncbi:MAG: hypothetical protein DSY87_07450 [Methylococcus sp.]|nr:MAG: hypothetical protein DSY87_07450 [Methylococcus sp.]
MQFVGYPMDLKKGFPPDTKEAIKMVRKGGVIIWHDYGLWKGVTRALEEIERKDNMGLRNIAGTSLVYWRKS